MTQRQLFQRMIDPRNRMTGHEQTEQTENHHLPPDWNFLLMEIENTKGIELNTIHPNNGWFNLQFEFDQLENNTLVHHYPKTAAGYHQALEEINQFQTV